MSMRIISCLSGLRRRLFAIHEISRHERLQTNWRPTAFFLFIILLYVIFQLAMQPSWMMDGEIWAEMGTNYYHHANSPSLFQKLFSTDAGYIPAPQRLIALLGNQLGLPAAWIPYFYTWSSVIFSAVLIGAFCLAPFRKIFESDFLRLMVATVILAVADFETRTFINFTYFSAFFISIVTALALIDDSEEVPWWAWFIPIFMMSKPAVLATLPAMIFAATVCRPRFRLITFFAIFLGLCQLSQMVVSSMGGAMPFRSDEIGVLYKFLAGVKYFLGFLGAYIVGPSLQLKRVSLVLIGAFILLVNISLLLFRRSSANALIFVGLSLVFFNFLLNSFALSDAWSLNMNKLHGVSIYRHTILAFFGCVLVVCGMVCSLVTVEYLGSNRWFVGGLGALLLFVWFWVAGWFAFAGRISKEPSPPTINSSEWQLMANAIDAGVTPLCVPINPWWKGANWLYQRNCGLLETPPAWEDGSVLVKGNLNLRIERPSSLLNRNLIAAAVLIRPVASGEPLVEVLMRIQLKDGSFRNFSGSRKINEFGGLLMLVGDGAIDGDEIEFFTLEFNLPLEVAVGPAGPTNVPGVAWMGYE